MLAWLWLDEVFDATQIMGMFLAIAGVAILGLRALMALMQIRRWRRTSTPAS